MALTIALMPSAFSKNEGMDEALAQNNDVSGPSPLESRSIPLCIQIDPDCGMAVNQQFSCIGQSNQMLWLHSTSWIRLFHCDTPLHDTPWKEDILGFSFSDRLISVASAAVHGALSRVGSSLGVAGTLPQRPASEKHSHHYAPHLTKTTTPPHFAPCEISPT